MFRSILFAVILTTALPAMAQEQVPLLISRGEAMCLATLDDLETLMTTDPVLLRLSDCPAIIVGARDLMKSSQNASPGLVVPKTGAGAEVLIMRRRQVVCVINQVKHAIAIAPEAEQVAIELFQCAGD